MAKRRRYIRDWTISEVRTLREGQAEVHLSTPTQIFILSTKTQANFKELIDAAGYGRDFLRTLEMLQTVCPTQQAKNDPQEER